MGKTLSGFPKIVTNNGEHIIYSSRPIFKKNKFSAYTNPNLLALNYSINALNENGVYARLGVLKKSSANPYVKAVDVLIKVLDLITPTTKIAEVAPEFWNSLFNALSVIN